MGNDNRRQAVRVECDLPVRLHGGAGDEYAGRIIDLSRTGLRLRIPGKLLGVHRLSSLVQVTRRLHETLGDQFRGELHYEMLGPLIQRTLKPCRIAKRDWEQTDVEIGCEFDIGLTAEEVGMLGMPLPAVGAEVAAPGLHGAGPVFRSGGSRHTLRPHPAAEPSYVAYLYPEPGKMSQPLATRTQTLSRGMAMLEVDAG
ncbi:MAG: PilZ domain-containing protein [Planctomycetota bacterium]|nr:PilZ domain-containing protein [Planctomycetota bacterium]